MELRIAQLLAAVESDSGSSIWGARAVILCGRRSKWVWGEPNTEGGICSGGAAGEIEPAGASKFPTIASSRHTASDAVLNKSHRLRVATAVGSKERRHYQLIRAEHGRQRRTEREDTQNNKQSSA